MQFILSADGLMFQTLIKYPPIEIPQAQTTFISGDSGRGKSTLFKLFNATVSPSKGTILYQGKNISAIDTVCLRREVLLASQSVFLFDGTIRNNFAEFFKYRELAAIDESAINRFLHICCAYFPLDTACETLSGGERQRVFLAIHMALSPTVLMLDEPTSALDEGTAHRMMHQVKVYCQQNQITLLVICHDSQMVKAFADKVIILERR